MILHSPALSSSFLPHTLKIVQFCFISTWVYSKEKQLLPRQFKQLWLPWAGREEKCRGKNNPALPCQVSFQSYICSFSQLQVSGCFRIPWWFYRMIHQGNTFHNSKPIGLSRRLPDMCQKRYNPGHGLTSHSRLTLVETWNGLHSPHPAWRPVWLEPLPGERSRCSWGENFRGGGNAL